MPDKEEILHEGNENLILFFDDDGDELRPGDRVLVNHEVEAMIGEIDGQRSLLGFPNDEIVHSLELLPREPGDEWPNEVV